MCLACSRGVVWSERRGVVVVMSMWWLIVAIIYKLVAISDLV